MENRAGYKKTELGWIPDEWEVVKLGDIGNFKNGINKGKEDFGQGIPFVNLMDVFGNISISNKSFGLVLASKQEICNYNLLKGDVLFIRSSVKPSGVGLTVLIEEDFPNTVYSGFLIRFRSIQSFLSNGFKKYCFYEEQFRRKLLAKSSVSANTNINQNSLSNLQIPLPPLPEQQKIASILTTVDDKISSIEAQIQQTEQLKKGLMAKLLTEGIGHTEFKDTEIGRLPQAWEVVPLAQANDIVDYRGKTPTKSDYGIFLITARNIKSGKIDYTLSQEYVSVETYDEVMRRGLPTIGDVLITTEAPLGEVATIDKEEVALAQRVIKLRGKSEILNNYFLKFYLMSQTFQDILDLESTGSTVKGIKGSRLKKMPVVIPPLPEQQQIASILSSVDDKLDVLQSKKTSYSTLKKGLMAKLLTGQMRVRI